MVKNSTISLLESHYEAIAACPLFRGLQRDELLSYLQSVPILLKNYQKHGFIAISGDPMEGIGIVVEGSALLTRENVPGQRVIMTELTQSSMFGEALLFTARPLWPATIKTTKPTTVLFIPLDSFIQTLPNCQYCQTKMLTNLLHDLSEKALTLTKKVHYLTLKGMREKIFAYLTDLYTMQQSTTLELPHSRQEMADALNVCRTALSRELGRLRDEHIIAIHGKTVHLQELDTILEYRF